MLLTDLTMQKRVDRAGRPSTAAREVQREQNRRVAREVNDTIVQGLVAAEMALDLGDADRARSLISRASGGRDGGSASWWRTTPAAGHGRPAQHSAPHGTATARDDLGARGAPGDRDEGLGVLIVDDSADIRDLDRDRADGQAGRVARGGSGGQRRGGGGRGAKDTQPSLVLLDIAMPVMDGMQALPAHPRGGAGRGRRAAVRVRRATAGDAAPQAGAHGYVEKEDLVMTLVPRLRSIMASPWS